MTSQDGATAQAWEALGGADGLAGRVGYRGYRGPSGLEGRGDGRSLAMQRLDS